MMVTNQFFVVILSVCVSYASVATDCNIVGGDTQNHESLRPINMPGYFMYPIPCNGTLVAVNATGFCIVTNRTDQQVSLLLAVYQESNGIPMPTYRHITADCEFAKNNSVSGIDYSLGSVSDNDLNIPVTLGEFLSVDFFSKCDFSCPFQTAIINVPSKHTLLFLESIAEVDVANLKVFSDISLLFSATIETSSNKKGQSFSSIAAVTISATVVIVLAVISGIILYFYFYFKKKKGKDKKIKPKKGRETDISQNQDLDTDLENQYFPGKTMESPLLQQLHTKVKDGMIVSKNEIHLTSLVGQGEFGVVYRGYFNTKKGKQLVAIKTCKPLSSSVEKEKLLNEVSIMSLFVHPNVMPLLGLCFDEEMPLLIMPFMSKGNVLEYVKQNKLDLHKDQEASEVEVVMARKLCLGMCHQITKGMEYLARQKYVHRDLAARNCMIDSQGVIKVADFGLTEDMYATNYFCRDEKVVGSEEKVPIKWMAPESIESSLYNETTDVWSFGVTCWEVFTWGRVPYSGIPTMTLLKELLAGHRLDRPSNTVCSDEIWEIMTCCWCVQSIQRPKFAELVKIFSDLLETYSSYLKLNA